MTENVISEIAQETFPSLNPSNSSRMITEMLAISKVLGKPVLIMQFDLQGQSPPTKGTSQEGASCIHHHWSKFSEGKPNPPSMWMCSCPSEESFQTGRFHLAHLPLAHHYRTLCRKTYLSHLPNQNSRSYALIISVGHGM